jgi:DNA invertase Pin-like site-specific DNA recombinase
VARVSTREQHPASQHDALTAAGCERIFTDLVSGKLARRPELDKALMVAREGDQLVATRLDRLGRSLENLIDLSKQLQAKKVDLVVLDQNIDTSTSLGRMFFQILGAIAEFEGALASERTRDGLAAARARGRTGGQKPKLGRAGQVGGGNAVGAQRGRRRLAVQPRAILGGCTRWWMRYRRPRTTYACGSRPV